MNNLLVLTTLLAAAALEAGGDALVRGGILHPNPLRRLALFLAGGFVLFVYGYLVNASRIDFGRLIGVYVAIFFLMAQVIAWVGFQTKPTASIVVGGALIVTGSLVITLWKC